MADDLDILLRRIRDGLASSDELAAARARVAADDRLPEELRAIVLVDEAEAPSDAAGLLSVLGRDDLGQLLTEAIRAEAEIGAPDLAVQERHEAWRAIADVLLAGLRAEARRVNLADGVLQRLESLHGWPWGPVLAEAVRSEAGRVEVAELVLDAVRLAPFRVPLAQAASATAGTVDVVAPVMQEVELPTALVPVAEAIRAEAGSVDVTGNVAQELGLSWGSPVATEAGAPVVSPTERPASLAAPWSLLAVANNHRAWAAVGLALAAAFLAMVVGNSLPTGSLAPSPAPMVFAKADEIVVEDLSYGRGADVFEALSDDGTVILWLDEEA